MWTTRRTLRAQLTSLQRRLREESERRIGACDRAEFEAAARAKTLRDLEALTARLRDLEAAHAALQARYDAAVGLDSPEVEAGRSWQERRPDRAKAAPPPSPAGAGDRLPVREPGEVT
ncbi:hypothetical protein JJV70_15280 [Streptomyces sp. JJ66]|uniref:hypothetical protein n=1 Tax=Streptomyces sp. JJ66 TaxID=2803843 RepID=UPI001C5854B1|nr:hypothetical protein [Streptomyces sp. JJ66]MBW1603442.1 hypothetical protein [Streptomyces sp. JJ66]